MRACSTIPSTGLQPHFIIPEAVILRVNGGLAHLNRGYLLMRLLRVGPRGDHSRQATALLLTGWVWEGSALRYAPRGTSIPSPQTPHPV